LGQSVVGLGILALTSTNAVPEILPLVATESRVAVTPLLKLFGSEFAGQPQFDGSMSTSYDGHIVLTHDAVGNTLSFGDGGSAIANLQSQNVRPGVQGRAGDAPGNYGATLSITDLHVGPVTIPDAGTFTVGTVESASIDVALRDVVAQLLPSGLIPINAGAFDASHVTIQILGNADLKSRIVTRANDTSDYRENLAALELLDSTSDIVTSVSGSCSALELVFGCSSRRITVDLETRRSIDELVVNESQNGEFTSDGGQLALTLPITFTITQNLLDGVLDFELDATGQVVGSLPTASPGDFDESDTVDATDYAIWRASFGSTSSLAADANGNGIVDAADYTVWRNNLPTGASAASAAFVPEPTTITLLLVLALRMSRLGNR
jgi:hypothetical protein